MNKQELIERLERLIGYGSRDYIERNEVLDLAKQLDEPEKVKVPQCVADWIEVCKEHLTTSLYTAMNPNFMKENNQSFDLILWIKKTSNQETFARAWILDYEVEKEKRYKVVMPNVSSSGGVLTRIKHNDSWIWIDTLGTIVEGRTHTRKELEDAGFGWVFDCPGIEIEEVTD